METRRSSLAIALLVVFAGTNPGRVYAQPNADPALQKARVLFKDAELAYQLGEFQRSLSLYAEAYRVKPLPGFLFNIGQCYRQLGDYKQAAFAYGRFINNSRPNAENLDTARDLMAEMRRKQAEKEAADQAEDVRVAAVAARLGLTPVGVVSTRGLPPLPTFPEGPRPWYKKGWVWGVIAGSAVLVAGGITAGVILGKAYPILPAPSPYTFPYDGRYNGIDKNKP